MLGAALVAMASAALTACLLRRATEALARQAIHADRALFGPLIARGWVRH